MKYWAWFVAKVSVAALLLAGLWKLLGALMPEPETFLRYRVSRFPQDLPWTAALLAFWLFSLALVWMIVADQRRRCRTCARRLRMPVNQGNFGYVSLFHPPRTESICPFGHGTLRVPEVHLEGSERSSWRPHDANIWRELDSLEGTKK